MMVFVVSAAMLLGYEHQPHLFGGNGLLLVLLTLSVGMHVFMHGGAEPGNGDRPRPMPRRLTDYGCW
ncbi:MAG: hypothetical protein CVV05_09300 [Gammaproteobacteria bacterium HGW-Gammaproteobacteria-1]|jgi:hypothetical protein|nr:MAG: hypothetical protein CVV05_09300 [Gammaproteobacteria bacterium HGW-Gammaproteobacteria-1]